MTRRSPLLLALATATAWTANPYTLDRWYQSSSSDAAGTHQQVLTGGPTGFPSYLQSKATTADATIAAPQYQWGMIQSIEGYNIADLDWGTANAKSVKVSFYVRSSKTGVFSVAIGVGSSAQYIFQQVTISAANTWELKTLTFAGNTTTAPASTTTGTGLILSFVTAAGSNYQGTANAWTSSVHLAAASNDNFLTPINTTFDITAVQLEVGSVATPFERRPYGTELAL